MKRLGPEIRRYRKGDAEDVASLAYLDDLVLAADPGSMGMALLFRPVRDWSGDPPGPVASYPLTGFAGHRALSQVADFVDGEPLSTKLVLVIEESFAAGRGNSGSDLMLARYCGSVIGAVAAHVHAINLSVVLVPAASWYSALKKASGDGKKRKARKLAARMHAVAELGADAVDLSARRAEHREAFCDAYGIATWWGEFCRRADRARRVVSGAR